MTSHKFDIFWLPSPLYHTLMPYSAVVAEWSNTGANSSSNQSYTDPGSNTFQDYIDTGINSTHALA